MPNKSAGPSSTIHEGRERGSRAQYCGSWVTSGKAQDPSIPFLTCVFHVRCRWGFRYVSSGGVDREFVVILEEVDLRMELAHYDIIYCEDMGKTNLGLDDAISCEWKAMDFSMMWLDFVKLSTQSRVSGGGGSSLTWCFSVSFLLVISIFLNQFRKKILSGLKYGEN